MNKKVLIVIGDRLGKGQKVAEGINKAGGEAYVIPGLAADMKLGKIMHEKSADLGISFCGSGGAGALCASNEFGYSCRYQMSSVLEAINAINDDIKVLGFSFMDSEELGYEICKAYYAKKNN